jgi:hypothetical protein
MKTNSIIFLWCACALSTFGSDALFWGGPELETVKWESRGLSCVDINGDERKDVAIINGVERAIDVFYQTDGLKVVSRPNGKLTEPLNVLTRFDKSRIALASAPSDFIFGDFDGDGNLDLAYTSTREGLVFMQRTARGDWSVRKRMSDVKATAFTHQMWFGPLTPKGPKYLLVLAEGELLQIDSSLEIVARYGNVRKDAYYLSATDVNSDGLSDIAYEYASDVGLAYRLQTAAGRFDAEHILSYDADNNAFFGYAGDEFYFFGGTTSTVESREVVADPLSIGREICSASADVSNAIWADMDGDGTPEVLAVDDDRAQLCVWKQTNGVLSLLSSSPTLKGVSSLVALPNGKVAVFSSEEKSVGVSSFDAKEGVLSFPALLEVPGEPVGLVGVAGRAWVIERSGDAYAARAIEAEGVARTGLRLDGIKRAPDSFAAYGEGSGNLLLVAYQGRDEAQLFSLSEKAARPVKISQTLSRANFAGLDPSKVAWAEVSGKGSLLVSQKVALRVFAFDGESINLTDQTLPVVGDASLRLPFGCDGKLWAYDGHGKRWVSFVRSDREQYEFGASYEALPFDPGLVLVGTNSFIAAGGQSLGIYTPSKIGEKFKTTQRFESNIDIDGYNMASLEDLAPDGKFALLFNQPKRILEMVRVSDMKSLANFTLYDIDPHYSGRKGESVEPREIIADDVTGDGRADLIMLMHNKLAVYPRVEK